MGILPEGCTPISALFFIHSDGSRYQWINHDIGYMKISDHTNSGGVDLERLFGYTQGDIDNSNGELVLRGSDLPKVFNKEVWIVNVNGVKHRDCVYDQNSGRVTGLGGYVNSPVPLTITLSFL